MAVVNYHTLALTTELLCGKAARALNPVHVLFSSQCRCTAYSHVGVRTPMPVPEEVRVSQQITQLCPRESSE